MGDKKVRYKDEKARRWILGDDTEFIAVILDEKATTGFGAGVNVQGGGKVEFERRKEKLVLATYIRDPEIGLLPHDVWVEKKRKEVASTLSAHTDMSIDPKTITVTSGVESQVVMSCPKCSKMIFAGSKFCAYCGTPLDPNQ